MESRMYGLTTRDVRSIAYQLAEKNNMYCPSVFQDIDFVAAEVTEQNIPQHDGVHEENGDGHEQIEEVIDENNGAHEENDEVNEKSIENNEQNDALPTIIVPQSYLALVDEPLTSKSGFNILPSDVHPLPKMAQEKRSSKSRKSGGTVVLISRPYKKQLLEEQQKKEKQVEKNNLKTNNKLAEKKDKNYKESSEESEEEEDTECLICTETFLQSNLEEGWVQCSMCYRCAHDEGAGLDDDDCDQYCCDYCIDNAKLADTARSSIQPRIAAGAAVGVASGGKGGTRAAHSRIEVHGGWQATACSATYDHRIVSVVNARRRGLSMTPFIRSVRGRREWWTLVS
ncbi:unnamed protein product [Acanthoscelides obtectus]|uniref:Uncharacterized protein n=1 Tax=Acanthoscelides obtectus TaxID=200917 RepID=A0A9P0NUB8_ACAOB|nr:unnamed protein product [Acanthoscelides obtectus]CAK1639841.1 hypothetical protein AOBTE_LOCUS11406 [Acanthoscelides obtectus]